MPKKERPASIRIAEAIPNAMLTNTGANALGRACWKIVRAHAGRRTFKVVGVAPAPACLPRTAAKIAAHGHELRQRLLFRLVTSLIAESS